MTASNRTPPTPYLPDMPSHVQCPKCETMYDTDTLVISLDGRTQCRTCFAWIQAMRVPSTMRTRNPGKLAYRARKKAENDTRRAKETDRTS